MPCLLKERTADSPGIISFTHNEAINGFLLHSEKAQALLAENTRAKRWLYGVQIQGDCSWLKEWPLAAWHSFILWPNASESYLANVPPGMVLGMNCVNFMPDLARPDFERNVDLCVISRPSEIKRIHETLLTIRALMDIRPKLTATLVVPDPRQIELGESCYEIQHIDQRFFAQPLKLFSATELKQISFICTSEQAFGRFPLSQNIMTDLLSRSRFMFLASHREGTPRVIAEALLTGTPCIVARALQSGILSSLDAANSLAVDDDPKLAARQINEALENYSRYHVDVEDARHNFAASANKERLQSWLSRRIETFGRPVDGRWFLEDLSMRLACHGRRINLQYVNNEPGFFDWMEKVDRIRLDPTIDPYDEDSLYGVTDLNFPDAGKPSQLVQSIRKIGRRIKHGFHA